MIMFVWIRFSVIRKVWCGRCLVMVVVIGVRMM